MQTVSTRAPEQGAFSVWISDPSTGDRMDTINIMVGSLIIYFAALGIAELKARRAVRNTVYMVRPKKD